MIAFMTTSGEPTADLCAWALQRNGFELHTVSGTNSLAEKLKFIYEEAYRLECDFVRVDADIIVNRNFTPARIMAIGNDSYYKDIKWLQFITFDWFKQDIAYSMAYIKKDIVGILKNNIGRFMDNLRPETECSRITELFNPRKFKTYDREIMGLHGYGIKDLEPVRKLKEARGHLEYYDFELAERLNRL